tara:strand:+ start:174 stop:416 length:243 start_codon:yes stop_codon:yes gene_type:complete
MDLQIGRLNRLDQISFAHPWIPKRDLILILHHTFHRFADKYSGQRLQMHLDHWTDMACSISEHEMKDFMSRVKEFAVYED